MGDFRDLQHASEEVSFRQGVERGLTLVRDRQLFLEQTTLQQMRWKKYKEKYRELFNTET